LTDAGDGWHVPCNRDTAREQTKEFAMSKIRKELWWTAIALALLVGFLAPATPAADTTMVVKVNEPFVINGQAYAAGEISLRRFASYSPISSLHEVRVNGQSFGYVMARNNPDSDEVSKSNRVVFERNAQGRLVLASLATRGEPLRDLLPFGTPAELEAIQRASLNAEAGTLLASME